MTFNPHTQEDRQVMLAATGLASIEALFGAIPESVRFPELDLPAPLSEQEAYRRLSQLSARNMNALDNPSFLGAGSYTHYIPAAVQQITFRGEFYTAYTPYQPEVAQGTLQAIYEYQSMICALTGMEVSNASLYDGATALAEGALLTISLPRKRTRVVVAGTVHPNYVNVVRTYTSGIGVDVIQVPLPADGLKTDPSVFDEYLDENLACIVVQYPNFFGTIEDIAAIGEKAHSAGANLVVSTYPTALGILKTPAANSAPTLSPAKDNHLATASRLAGRSSVFSRHSSGWSDKCLDDSQGLPTTAKASADSSSPFKRGNSTSGEKKRRATSAPIRG